MRYAAWLLKEKIGERGVRGIIERLEILKYHGQKKSREKRGICHREAERGTEPGKNTTFFEEEGKVIFQSCRDES